MQGRIHAGDDPERGAPASSAVSEELPGPRRERQGGRLTAPGSGRPGL